MKANDINDLKKRIRVIFGVDALLHPSYPLFEMAGDGVAFDMQEIAKILGIDAPTAVGVAVAVLLKVDRRAARPLGEFQNRLYVARKRPVKDQQKGSTEWTPVDLLPGHTWRECVCAAIDPRDRPCVVCECRGTADKDVDMLNEIQEEP